MARFAVTPQVFIDAAKHGLAACRVVAGQLPDDARYYRAAWDPAHEVIWIVVESATFADVEEGAVVPELPPPVFRRMEDDAPATRIESAGGQ